MSTASVIGFSTIGTSLINTAIMELLNGYFPNTLLKVPDILRILRSQYYAESSLNYINSISSRDYGPDALKTLQSYPAVSVVFNTGSKEQQANIIKANSAYGIGQVSGPYIITGASPNGKGELYGMNPSLASTLMINPGDDVTSVLWGESNLHNQILASLIVLDFKYRTLSDRLVSTGQFNSKIAAALGAYLGLGVADSNGTNARQYAANILTGDAFNKANNPFSYAAELSTNNPGGPPKTAASGNNQCMLGCS